MDQEIKKEAVCQGGSQEMVEYLLKFYLSSFGAVLKPSLFSYSHSCESIGIFLYFFLRSKIKISRNLKKSLPNYISHMFLHIFLF